MIGAADFLDHAVNAKAFEGAGDLRAAEIGEMLTQGSVGEAADTMLSAHERFHESLVLGIEQVESRIAVFALVAGLGDFAERIDARRWCVARRDELQVASVGRTQRVSQVATNCRCPFSYESLWFRSYHRDVLPCGSA